MVNTGESLAGFCNGLPQAEVVIVPSERYQIICPSFNGAVYINSPVSLI
jgi:hypothetical protein